MAELSLKLSELTGFGDQIKSAFAAVKKLAKQADVRLRQEIGQATGVLRCDFIGQKINWRINDLEICQAKKTDNPNAKKTMLETWLRVGNKKNKKE